MRQVHREGVTHGKGRVPPGKEAHLVCLQVGRTSPWIHGSLPDLLPGQHLTPRTISRACFFKSDLSCSSQPYTVY